MASFISLGLLLGLLIGLSRESLVTQTIPILITFAGGSAVAFFSNKSAEQRRNAHASILSLSIGAILGLACAIIAADNQLLTFRSNKDDLRKTIEDRKYLRAGDLTNIGKIREEVTIHDYPKDRAYDDLIKVLDGAK